MWKSRDRLAWGDAAKDKEIADGDANALWEQGAERWLGKEYPPSRPRDPSSTPTATYRYSQGQGQEEQAQHQQVQPAVNTKNSENKDNDVDISKIKFDVRVMCANEAEYKKKIDGESPVMGDEEAYVRFHRAAVLGGDYCETFRDLKNKKEFSAQVYDADRCDFFEVAPGEWKSRDRLSWGDATKDREIAAGDGMALMEQAAERWLAKEYPAPGAEKPAATQV